jgi:hypothetical protein
VSGKQDAWLKCDEPITAAGVVSNRDAISIDRSRAPQPTRRTNENFVAGYGYSPPVHFSQKHRRIPAMPRSLRVATGDIEVTRTSGSDPCSGAFPAARVGSVDYEALDL